MKHVRVLIVAAVLALALPGAALADHLKGSNDWTVTYTSGGQMDSNFSSSQYADDVSGLQPGDDITLTVKLSHQNKQAADWYMSNEVLKSLEEGAAQGSAYGYRLTYAGPSGSSRVLYDSQTVGGDDTSGLLDATSALEDFFYLDNLSNGQTATVQLVVSLDGETEGNAYFDTLARLQMKFAVEPTTNATGTTGSSSGSSTRAAVQTGDDTNLFPLFVTMAVSGLLLLVLCITGLRQRRRDNQGVAR